MLTPAIPRTPQPSPICWSLQAALPLISVSASSRESPTRADEAHPHQWRPPATGADDPPRTPSRPSRGVLPVSNYLAVCNVPGELSGRRSVGRSGRGCGIGGQARRAGALATEGFDGSVAAVQRACLCGGGGGGVEMALFLLLHGSVVCHRTST
ncbi:hypothetical protein BJ546DRAFT_960918 [Cryomyces antarcticus]